MKGVVKVECGECLENISALIDGELNGFEQKQVENHLLACGRCKAVANQFRLLNFGIVHAVENIPAPRGLEERILLSIGLERQKAKKQFSLTSLFLILLVSPLLIFSSLIWRFVYLVYSTGTILGRAESVLLRFVPPATSWAIGIMAFFLIVGGVLLVRRLLKGFQFNEVFS